MRETPELKLKYFNTSWREYQWFLIYEFQISEKGFFKIKDEEILNKLIGTRVFSKILHHPELENKETEVSVQDISRPYEIENVTFSDFKFLESKAEFENWIIKFRTKGWEDDRNDAQILIEKAEKEIWSRTSLKNGVWYLSKDNFEEESNKLNQIHWVYLHFETFIEIDRENTLIRTFDFGYD